MRTRVRRFAHVLERIGLAMAGAASGLFVGVHVGSSIAALRSEAFLLIMMVSGTVGFYLGIDTPPAPFHPHDDSSKIDSAEFLSAVGTFLAALAAFSAVGIIVSSRNTHRLDNHDLVRVGGGCADADFCRRYHALSRESNRDREVSVGHAFTCPVL
jgi:hypothetical protein